MSTTQTLSNYYANRKVLITGGASFIGSHLAELLCAADAIVTVADDLSSGEGDNLSQINSQITFLEGDLRIAEFAAGAMQQQDTVFHLAAAHGGRGFIDTHPVECLGNMALDHCVFEHAVKAGVRRIVFASSACVYPTDLQSDPKSGLLLAESEANFEERGKAYSDGEYGWAKLMGELQLNAFCKQHGIDGVACRIFTAYGERENESHAVIALIAKALKRLDPFPIWGDGLQTRNFTYVKDTVMGLALAAITAKGFSTLNVGSSRHVTVLELLDEIFATLSWRPSEILKELDRPVGVKSRAASNERCVRVTGWEPTTTVKEGISYTVAWYQQFATPERLDDLERLLTERK